MVKIIKYPIGFYLLKRRDFIIFISNHVTCIHNVTLQCNKNLLIKGIIIWIFIYEWTYEYKVEENN